MLRQYKRIGDSREELAKIMKEKWATYERQVKELTKNRDKCLEEWAKGEKTIASLIQEREKMRLRI